VFIREKMKQFTAVLIALLVLSLPSLARGPGATAPKSSPLISSIHSVTQFAADLNGDRTSENIDLLSYGSSRTIRIEFANLPNSYLTFPAAGARRGFVIPYDIDHDTDLDLIWTAGGDKKDFVICINDGRANFHVAPEAAYASKIDALLTDSDPTDQQSLHVGRGDQSVSATPSSKIALATVRAFRFITVATILFSPPLDRTTPSPFLHYLKQRGPPAAF
jgi:hypothetical protein